MLPTSTHPDDPHLPSPTFSVIVAIYNAERYLEETLTSIQAQTWRNFEVVLVDDGSTDDSASIAQKFVDSDARFRLLSTPNRGISPTRNLAIDHARGEWLAICDADDLWDARKLEIQARFIHAWDEESEGPLVALGTSGFIINGVGRFWRIEDLGIHSVDEYRRWRDEIGQMAMINSSVVCRRNLVLELGGYRADYTPAEDTDLWTRLADLGVVLNLPERLTHYRIHGDNISESSYVRMMMNLLRIRANSKRRRLGEPELDYEGHLALRRLRHERYYYAARMRWNNGQRVSGLSSALQATLIAPELTLHQLQESYYFRTRRARR